jgi:hypothetical protein
MSVGLEALDVQAQARPQVRVLKPALWANGASCISQNAS